MGSECGHEVGEKWSLIRHAEQCLRNARGERRQVEVKVACFYAGQHRFKLPVSPLVRSFCRSCRSGAVVFCTELSVDTG